MTIHISTPGLRRKKEKQTKEELYTKNQKQNFKLADDPKPLAFKFGGFSLPEIG